MAELTAEERRLIDETLGENDTEHPPRENEAPEDPDVLRLVIPPTLFGPSLHVPTMEERDAMIARAKARFRAQAVYQMSMKIYLERTCRPEGTGGPAVAEQSIREAKAFMEAADALGILPEYGPVMGVPYG
jgi:hypothetical protein